MSSTGPSIDDILNASDSDDDNILSSNPLDLEKLLQDEGADDNNTYISPSISTSTPQTNADLFTNLMDRSSNMLKQAFDITLLDDDDSPKPISYELENALSNNVLEEADNDSLAAFHAAEKRELRTLHSGVQNVALALQTKRYALRQNYVKSDLELALQNNFPSISTAQSLKYGNIKCIEMYILSSQLRRNASLKKHGPGVAISLLVHSKFIAVGTSKGLILLFDHGEEIRQVIGSAVTETARCQSPVTAIDANITGALLLCGYETGEVTLWDVIKGIPLKRIMDLHTDIVTRAKFINPAGNADSNISTSGTFTNEILFVVTADCRDIAHRIKFTKSVMFNSYTSEFDCLLNGSAGNILDICSLPSCSNVAGTINSSTVPVFTPGSAPSTSASDKAATTTVESSNSTRNRSASSASVSNSIMLGVATMTSSLPLSGSLNSLTSAAQTKGLFKTHIPPTWSFLAICTAGKTYIVQSNPSAKICFKWASPSTSATLGSSAGTESTETPASQVKADIQQSPTISPSKSRRSLTSSDSTSTPVVCLDWVWTKHLSLTQQQAALSRASTTHDVTLSKSTLSSASNLPQQATNEIALSTPTCDSRSNSTSLEPIKKPQSIVTGNNDESNVYHPVLVRSWNNTVQTLLVAPSSTMSSTSATASSNVSTPASVQSKESILILAFNVLKERSFPIKCFVSIKWLNENTLIAMTITEVFILNLELETLESVIVNAAVLSCNQIALAECSEVSASPQKCLRNFVGVESNKFYVLSSELLQYFQVKPWTDRIDALIEASEWLEALAVVLEFSFPENDAQLSTIHSNMANMAAIKVDNEIIDKYIKRYVDLAIAQPQQILVCNLPSSTAVNSSSNLGHSRNHYHLVAGVCIEYCIAAHREQLLFSDIFQVFVSLGYESIFLESMEPFIFTRAITSLPSFIIESFIESTKRTQKYALFERCILYINTALNDNHTISTIETFLFERQLISGYLYVRGYCKQDIISAFKTMFDLMLSFDQRDGISNYEEKSSFPTPEQANIGFKLLLLMSYISDNKIFPRGDPYNHNSDVLMDFVEELFKVDSTLPDDFEHPASSKPIDPTNIAVAVDSDDDEDDVFVEPVGTSDNSMEDLVLLHSAKRLQYLPVLIRIDPSALIHCTSKLFRRMHNNIFASCSKTIKSSSVGRNELSSKLAKLFNLFYYFTVAIDETTQSMNECVRRYFDQCATEIISIPSPLTFGIIKGILSYYSNYFINTSTSASQLSRLEIENSIGIMVSNQSMHPHLLLTLKNLLTTYSYWRSLLFMNNRRFFVYDAHLFENGIKGYLALLSSKRKEKDKSFNSKSGITTNESFTNNINSFSNDSSILFAYINEEIKSAQVDSVPELVMKELKIIVCKYLIDLYELNSRLTEAFVIDYLISYASEIIQNTKRNLSIQFHLLHSVVTTICDNSNISPDFSINAVSPTSTENHHRRQQQQKKAHSELTKFLTQDEVLIYIRLLVLNQPTKLHQFLQLTDHYPLDEVIDICRQEKDAYESTAYLLEKAGDIDSSLHVLYSALSRKIVVCKREIERQLRNDALMSRVVTATSTVSASGPAVNTNRSSSDEKTNKQDKESIFSIASQILQRQGTAKLDLATKLEFYNEMQKIVTNMSILCQRHSTKSNTSYWFNTFDKLLAERQLVRKGGSTTSSDILLILLGMLLYGFMSQMKISVPPQDIIRRATSGISSSSSGASQHGQGQGSIADSYFVEFKDVMVTMINEYEADQQNYELLRNMIRQDLLALNVKKFITLCSAQRVAEGDIHRELEKARTTFSHNRTQEQDDGVTMTRDRKIDSALELSRSAREVHIDKIKRLQASFKRLNIRSEEVQTQTLQLKPLSISSASAAVVGGSTFLDTSPPPIHIDDNAPLVSARKPGSLPKKPTYKAVYDGEEIWD